MEKEPKEVLCKNLKLTIIRENFEDTGTEEIVRMQLTDDLAMSVAEICHAISQSTHYSRRYHVKEAIVIGLRRLVDEAIGQEMIKISVSHGGSTRSNIPSAPPSATPRPTTSWTGAGS